MNRVVCALVSLLFLVVSLGIAGANASEGRSRVKIEWPSSDFRDLQAAINAAPDRALVQIKEGIYQINEPLIVRGKRLVIEGAGAGRTPGAPFTRLVGPAPRPVLDERGNIVLRADAVQGLLNLFASDVEVRDMQLFGHDAGIVSKPDEAGRSGPTRVHDVVIADTGRGILSLSPAELSVSDSVIKSVLCNGIAVNPGPDGGGSTTVVDSFVGLAACAGIYFANTTAVLDHVVVANAAHGGIVGFKSAAVIVDSLLTDNRVAGILLQGSKAIPLLKDNTILNTLASDNGFLGDGIVLVTSLSEANLFRNVIHQSSGAGVSVFGATGIFVDNKITCSTFDLYGEEYLGFPFYLVDAGGNLCGCPTAGQICVAKGMGLVPPPPVGGLE